jgi:hypothetical protein
VVAALLAAASVPGVEGQVLNIASGEAVGVGHLWSLICELAGRRREAQAPTYSPPPPWEPMHLRVSIARAARSLGYAPAVRLREGLRRAIDHYQAATREQRPTGDNAWFSPPAPESPDAATARVGLGLAAASGSSRGLSPLPVAPAARPALARLADQANGWPRPTRSVPPPPPPPPHALAARPPGAPPRATPPPPPPAVDLTAEDLEIEPDHEGAELDVEWAPVPAPWGSR